MTAAADFDLRRHRRLEGLSLRRFASACGLNRGTVDKAERGGPISLASAKKIADQVGMSVEDLEAAGLEISE